MIKLNHRQMLFLPSDLQFDPNIWHRFSSSDIWHLALIVLLCQQLAHLIRHNSIPSSQCTILYQNVPFAKNFTINQLFLWNEFCPCQLSSTAKSESLNGTYKRYDCSPAWIFKLKFALIKYAPGTTRPM